MRLSIGLVKVSGATRYGDNPRRDEKYLPNPFYPLDRWLADTHEIIRGVQKDLERKTKSSN